MRVDKTLSELWNLRACHSHDSFQELKEEASETAFMAISTIQNLQEEVDRLQRRNLRYANTIIKSKETIREKTLDVLFYHNEVLQRYYSLKDENKVLRKALEEIKETFTYGQPNHDGEVMVEVDDTCDAMYQIAVNATTISD